MFSVLAYVMVTLTVITLVVDIIQSFTNPSKLSESSVLTPLTDLKLILFLIISFNSIVSFLVGVAVFFFAGYVAKASKGSAYKIGFIWGRTNNMPVRNILEDLFMYRFPIHLAIALPSILILLNLI